MKLIHYDYEAFGGPPEFWFKTSKYLIKLNPNYFNDNSVIFTNKLSNHPDPPLKIKNISICNKKHKVIASINAELAFNVLPHIDDMIEYVHLLSDQKINEKLERLLKLKCFI